ncbi:phage integrase family protein [Orientia tsutsugamushi str. Gilliam]|uniref:Integrase n=1 Tax=Orientia tsutsugamushi str. Gilliam TaxID=1359184 RepID=A0A0F3M835_ORITS|nr:tyrosine-type recombinase/integrase [Orientia tsutsugamushi]KJV51938.1 phage integrase family protein [Orientia tsutsugamushi str. Gilliam]KJV52029.1 phage integrase family protein [Orientia tsutsugamushi str. Gilliam]SPR02979.1 integrase [Orientia tsutsugamushi str. Gilliam]SPR05153.1 integrase [Orientia tsutsugamushi str. Gilliam]
MEILQARKFTSESKWELPSATRASGHLERPNKSWHRVCKKAGIKNLMIHDLRRTLASCMSDAGASHRTISIALNHMNTNSTIHYNI